MRVLKGAHSFCHRFEHLAVRIFLAGHMKEGQLLIQSTSWHVKRTILFGVGGEGEIER